MEARSWADTVKLGEYVLKNRVFLSALTRRRCDPKNGIPTDLLVTYYSQRAGAGLLFTEAASWSQRGQGFPGAANLYTHQQAEGWRKVTDAVHAKGSRIFIQLCHTGRATNPTKTGGLQPWAPSAIAIRDENGKQSNNTVPKQMTLADIEKVKEEFQESVKLAKIAGFDGVSMHGAFGYLIDQFFRSYSNRRTDHYGGSAENRIRFAVELIDIALKHWEPYQVSIKLSPTSRFQDMFDQKPLETYSLFLQELNNRKIGSVQLAEAASVYNDGPKDHIAPKDQIPDISEAFRPFFSGLIIGNYGYNAESGLVKIRKGLIDAVTFGRSYIGNPDLAERIIANHPINAQLDFKTFYVNETIPDLSKGYTDYPFYSQ